MIVGTWAGPQYEEAFAQGLRVSGVEVSAVSTSNFFKGFFGRIQKTIPFPGPALLRLNRAVVDAAKEQQPDLVLFWRPTHVLPKTISKLTSMGVLTASYNNDDPFGPKAHGNVPWHHHFLWHWYIKCLPLFNYNFFFRKINCAEAKAHGARHTEVLLPYFMPWKDHPVQLTTAEQQRYETEVVFVGHHEPDGREGSIRALVSAGIRVKLWGGHYWSRAVLGDLYDSLSPIVPAEGDDYGKALCGAKICLCFLSKLNRDTYTRRCFEIPACGKVMLAERTDDLMQLFKEDEEACFFSSPEELVRKAQWLINNPDIRESIAQAGLRRVWADRHDVTSRARKFLQKIS
ncbi:MAG: glycosyltransferase [Methylococcales bacterium]|jgi:spore maturation protein CgeB|nr:glycosyltransferase [Methylococcales bacterium]